MSESNLEELMCAYVSGDTSAFSAMYRRVSPSVYSYLLRLTRNQLRAVALLKVTFTKVQKARNSYIPGAPPIPWMLAIARRAYVDERRMKKSHFEDLSLRGGLPERQEGSQGVRDGLVDAPERALDALPEYLREAIHLTRINGLSLAEAADVLDTTSSAVKLRIQRGYDAMRNQLGAL